MKKILFLMAVLVGWPGLVFASADNPFEFKPEEGNAGWEQVYAFPVSSEEINFFDKSRPFPEIIKKFAEKPDYSWSGPPAVAGAFPLTVNSTVESWISFWANNKKTVRSYLERSGLYSEIINAEIRRRGMPPELFYLAMIESGFHPRIKSWAGARGIWQFIKGTGRRYGLRIDYWVDERCDPVKSTEAALNYLSDLYGMFGDWHLAAASYNCGEERVAYKLMSTGCRDYWCLSEQKALPAETRNYVPKIISATIVCSNLEKYGIYNVQYLAPMRYSQVTVGQATDLRVIAKCAGTSVKEIEFLNPELIWWCTPPNRDYKVNIPYGRAQEFYIAYARLNEDEKTAFKYHTVKTGESVASIARAYGTRDVKMLAAMNDISVDTALKPGQKLIIPVPKDRPYQEGGDLRLRTRPDSKGVVPEIDADFVEPRPREKEKGSRSTPREKGVTKPSAEERGSREFLEYTIEPDDTLWVIASWSGVSVEELKRINNIKDETTIQYGDVLKIPANKGPVKMPPKSDKPKYKTTGPTRTIEYTVRPGDRCYTIARHYGIHSTEIIEKNNLDLSCSIKPTQKLTLVVPKDAPSTLPPLPSESAPAAKDTAASLTPPSKTPATTSSKGGIKTLYTVKEGDSLWQIARNHDTHVADIISWNSIESQDLRPGQKLIIFPGPAYKGPIINPDKEKGASASPGKDKGASRAGDKSASQMASADSAVPRSGPDKSPSPPARDKSTPPPAADKTKDKTSEAKADKTAPASSAPCKNPITYVVQPGESLWLIARRHDCRCDDIRALNNLASDDLRPNQKLLVCPGPEAGKVSSPTSASPPAAAKPPAAKTDTAGRKKITYTVQQGDSLWLIARKHDLYVADLMNWNNLTSESVRPGQQLIIYVKP